MRYSYLILALAMIVSAAPAISAADEVQLRGFGPLRLEEHAAQPTGSSWFTFTAADPTRAILCAGKYLADATAIGPVRVVTDSGLPGTVLNLAPAGWWLLGTEDRRCHIVFAPTREGLTERAKAVGANTWKAVDASAYPRWLDCFDNAALGFWVLGGGENPQDLEADMRWFGENRFAMCATGVDETRLVAPGVLDTTVLDWYAAKAKQYGVPYRMLQGWAGAGRPAWVRNVVPLPHVPPAEAPSVIAPVFDRQNMAQEVAFEPLDATDPWAFDSRRRIAAHAARDPYFMGHHVAAEFGGSSLLTLERVAGLPETTRAWRAWLRDSLRLDLRAVSLRHTGNADAYTSWDQVPLPRIRDFIGGNDAIDLRGVWEGHADRGKAGGDGQWFDPTKAPATGWVPIDCNDAMLLLYARQWSPDHNPSYWLRRIVDIPAERLKTPQFLHISRSWWHGAQGSMRVWLNGKPLQDLSSANPVANDCDQTFALGDAAVPGPNRLVLDTRGTPVASYIFISGSGRISFPNMSQPLNQRYADALEFAPHLRAVGLENAMIATRHGDPDRPMKVMAPTDHYDAFIDLFAKYGAYPHDTGQSGACWAPWTTSMIQARGGQHSCEPGNPAWTAGELKQFITYYLLLGVDAVDMVFHNELYRTKPELASWIAGNRQLLGCIGKMERVRPQVAVLRSNRTTRLGIDSPYNIDLTRGGLQACGRSGQLVDLPDIPAGVADAFPVLFDDATEVMSEADVDALEGYVRRGGTFVALHHTGRHAPDRANAWPITRLTGLSVRQGGSIGGKKISFSASQTLFPGLAGKSLDGWGMMLDWRNRDVTGAAQSLAAGGNDVEVIASWQDDLGIAVAQRRLGKGRVIILGSSFWCQGRDADRAFRSDPAQRTYLDQLLTALGVPRASTTPDPDVWAEAWRSKNGIFDLYPVVCMRSTPVTPVSGDIALARESAPTAVWEVSQNGSPLRLTSFADGRMVLPAVVAEPMQPRVFAAPRADLAKAPLHWLKTQTRQWPALAAPRPQPAPPATPEAEVVPLIEQWRVTAAAPADGWNSDPLVSAAWPNTRLGTFAAMGLPEESQVRAFRRTPLPAAWAGKRIRLVFDTNPWFWGLSQKARIWVGGKPLLVPGYAEEMQPRPEGSFSVDVTDRVRDGALDMAIDIDGRKQGDARKRPVGVTGVFMLTAASEPLASQDLSAWMAASDVNVLTPAPTGSNASFTYLETTFTLPKPWPAKRVYLRSPDADLHILVVNNHVVMVPTAQDRLDISGLVREGVNRIRWLPGGSTGGWPAFPTYEQQANRRVPTLNLAWYP